MKAATSLVVFSDLDGTLLDHDTYSWSAARPALSALRRIGAPLILSSSKTAVEIAKIQKELGISGLPAIVENGAGLLDARPDAADDYARLRLQLDRLPRDLRAPFEGFGDMDAARVAQITGLSLGDAANAKSRAYSEPGLWSGDAQTRAAFITALAAQGVSAREGGRFLTLSFGATKADGMAQVISQLKPRYTLALGDAPNDAEMLTAADFGVIVANPSRAPLPPLSGERGNQIIRTQHPGPEGWNMAVLAILKQLDLDQERDPTHG
ncbi:mannosyl-3-phosphoglycerate phosphatase [Yoonia tamlensis]|uniref:Mannosyl-3-phosphoglycerate phosphatase n=1 Tax=Yoonia tamlensis TaxID=390270 RepID=A0A1I6FPP0_9RHOB|nr:HAD-IIB family hydrolase [Yoonia tamlensis]SFR31844.1 mannosyl-3-phosphoglycerate phosphatase [Yoonia tamlensis]